MADPVHPVASVAAGASPEQLREQAGKLRARAHQAAGMLQAFEQRRAAAHARVAEAKGRQAIAKDVLSVFDAAQARVHERSVGAFERVLTAILQDVMPGEGTIKLDLSVKNNAPWLDVLIDKAGHAEDVFEDNGGGVNDVVSTGLRFAALSRAGLRRLVVLDEPDKWLKPTSVPAFVRVIAEVAKATRTQTLYVSHFPTSYFEGHYSLAHLFRAQDNSLQCEAVQPSIVEWADDQEEGIRAIELVNVGLHTHTIVPLRPGPNALVGDNNLGKSTAICKALKAVCYGESSDRLIQHDKPEARITLHLEKSRRLVWSRKPGRSPVVLYELYEGETLVDKSGQPKRGEAPAWVSELLNVRRADDLDIQLHGQKALPFLLSDTASRRAQILALGNEAGHIGTLLKEHTSIAAADLETIRTGEAEVTRLTEMRDLHAPLERAVESFSKVDAALDRFDAVALRTQQLARLVQALGRQDARVQALDEFFICSPAPDALPVLPQPEALARLCAALGRADSRAAHLASLPTAPALPAEPQTAALISMGMRLAAATTRVKALGQVPSKPDFVLPAEIDARLASVAATLPQRIAGAQSAQAALAGAADEVASLEAERKQLLEDSGEACPVCGSHLELNLGTPHQPHAH